MQEGAREKKNLRLKREKETSSPFIKLFKFFFFLFIFWSCLSQAFGRFNVAKETKEKKKESNYIFGKQTIITRYNRYNSKRNTAAGVRNNILAMEMGSAADSAVLNTPNYPYIGFL